MVNWIGSFRRKTSPSPLLQWERSEHGILWADYKMCRFEVVAAERGFLLMADGDTAGELRVAADSEAHAQQSAEHLAQCWPHWTITPEPVVQS